MAFCKARFYRPAAASRKFPTVAVRVNLGKSGWTLLGKVKYFVDGFVAYSFVPIRFITLLGILVFVPAVLLSFALVLQRVFLGTAAPGWTSVMIALLILHGLELLAIGIVGEYVWRALDQVRPRPLYLVDYFKPPVTPVV